jgi:membrane-associated phospholipid phosphatase
MTRPRPPCLPHGNPVTSARGGDARTQLRGAPGGVCGDLSVSPHSVAGAEAPSWALDAATFLVATGLVAALYWFGTGTEAGRSVDAYLLRHGDAGVVEVVGDSTVFLVNPVTVGLAALLVLLAARRCGRRADGTRALLIVVVAAMTSAALKRVLGNLDPLGHEAERFLGKGFFPSGHTSTAMALVLAIVLVFPPERRQLLRLILCVSAFGFFVSGGRGHHVTDVDGGFFVALAIASLCLLGRRARSIRGRTAGLAPRALGRGIVLLVAGVLVLESPRYLFTPADLPGEAANVLAVSLVASIVVLWFNWLAAHTEAR